MKHKLGDLKASELTLVNVSRDSPLSEATTKMILNDFSQLPVMNDERTLHGYISWKSIGTQYTIDPTKDKVKDYMKTDQIVLKESDDLLNSVNHILDKDFVIIKDDQNKITGIITIYDVAFQYRKLSEPIIHIEYIEKSLRKIIEPKLPIEEINEFFEEKNGFEGNINSINELTFGSYKNIIEYQIFWDKLKLKVNQKVIQEKLETVNNIRNTFMHFKADLADSDLHVLRNVANFFELLNIET